MLLCGGVILKYTIFRYKIILELIKRFREWFKMITTVFFLIQNLFLNNIDLIIIQDHIVMDLPLHF